MYRAIIFDLDGTLLNTLDDLANAVNFALESFGFPKRSTDEVRSFIGNGVKKLMERSTPDNTDEKTNEECLAVFRKFYLDHMQDNTKPYEKIEDMLKEIKSLGIITAVVSNKLNEAVIELCEKYFGNGIEKAIGVSKEAERKPNPVNVLKVLDIYALGKDEVIYVGDSEIDVMTAKNAGLRCIGVTWGYRSGKELISAGADYIIDSPKEIMKLIK